MKYIPFNVIILGDVWKVPAENRIEWIDSIDDCEIGNFINVKQGTLPTFERSFRSNGEPETTLIFGADVISKLHPASKCKNLNQQQSKNFYCEAKSNDPDKDNHIYYYAFNSVPNWEKEGGCVVVPQCTNNDCSKYACSEHMDLKKKPKEFEQIHVCGFDFEKKVCLLSHRQMIVNSFLKTGSTKPVYAPCDCVDDDCFTLKLN